MDSGSAKIREGLSGCPAKPTMSYPKPGRLLAVEKCVDLTVEFGFRVADQPQVVLDIGGKTRKVQERFRNDAIQSCQLI
jgi:hypothetical protein